MNEARSSYTASVAKSAIVFAAKKSAGVWLLVPVAMLAALLASTIVLAAIVSVITPSNGSATGSGGGAPSAYARQLIPPDMLTLYQASSVKKECPGLSWTIIAAITHVESSDNRNPGISTAGARGASQFMPTTWDRAGQLVIHVGPFGRVPNGQGYGVDGNGDGIADIMNPLDSVPAAARLLCANGGGDPKKLPDAIFAYNHAWWYVHGGLDNSGQPFIGVLPLAAKLADPIAPPMASGLVWPVLKSGSSVSSCYGPRFMGGVQDFHPGLDIAQAHGAPVFAAASGIVTIAGPVSGYGNHFVSIISDNRSFELQYGHMMAMTVVVGQKIIQGQQIGQVGNEGNSFGDHLHFNYIRSDLPHNSYNGNVDPLKLGLQIPAGVPNPNGCS